MASITDMIGDELVRLITLYCQTNVPDWASAYAATEVRQGLLQEDPVRNRITILVNPNDPDDTSNSPTWSDSLISEGDNGGFAMADYEIGGGERWWRRFTIDIYVYLVKTRENRDDAREIGLQLLHNVTRAVRAGEALNLTDDFDEHAFLMLVRKVVPVEGGGPPGSFTWRSKVRVAVATEIP